MGVPFVGRGGRGSEAGGRRTWAARRTCCANCARPFARPFVRRPPQRRFRSWTSPAHRPLAGDALLGATEHYDHQVTATAPKLRDAKEGGALLYHVIFFGNIVCGQHDIL